MPAMASRGWLLLLLLLSALHAASPESGSETGSSTPLPWDHDSDETLYTSSGEPVDAAPITTGPSPELTEPPSEAPESDVSPEPSPTTWKPDPPSTTLEPGPSPTATEPSPVLPDPIPAALQPEPVPPMPSSPPDPNIPPGMEDKELLAFRLEYADDDTLVALMEWAYDWVVRDRGHEDGLLLARDLPDFLHRTLNPAEEDIEDEERALLKAASDALREEQGLLADDMPVYIGFLSRGSPVRYVRQLAHDMHHQNRARRRRRLQQEGDEEEAPLKDRDL